LTNTTGVTVNNGAVLQLDNTSTLQLSGRLGTAPITMNGGTLTVLASNVAGGWTTESVGAITLASGHNIIQTTPNAAAGTAVIFTSAGLSRPAAGTTVNFQSTAVTPLGTSTNQILFTSSPALTSGILPYATVQSNATSSQDFPTYGSSGITAFTGYTVVP